MRYNFFIYLAVMAGVTYLTRMLPLALFRKEIKNRFVRSFLYYVPYAVLGAMTVPAVLYSTSGIWSAAFGTLVAFSLAYFKKSLLTVSFFACAAVFVCERAIELFSRI